MKKLTNFENHSIIKSTICKLLSDSTRLALY